LNPWISVRPECRLHKLFQDSLMARFDGLFLALETIFGLVFWLQAKSQTRCCWVKRLEQ